MSDWKEWIITDFTQGYVDKVDDTELATGALKDCRNMISRQIGRIVSRNGQAKLNSTEIGSGAGVQGLHSFYLGSTKYLVVAVAGTVYYCTPPLGTMTQIKTGLDATAPILFVTAYVDGKNQIIGFNGVDTPFKWDGTGTAQVETATVVAAAGITTAGNATVIVTAAGMTGTPVTLTVVALTDTTAALIATKIRAAMALNAGIAAWFHIDSTGADIVLTRKVASANDSTMNISVANDTCAGITDDTASTHTTAGVAPGVTDLSDYRIVSREEPTTTDFTVYTLANKPVRSGSDKFFVFSNADLLEYTDFTLDATNGTITFPTARINAVTSYTDEDAATVTHPLNGRIESLHPYKAGCTVTIYDKDGNALKALTDETAVDSWKADYANGVVTAPTSVDTPVTAEALSTNDHLTYTADLPFKSTVVPVVYDKDSNVLTPSSIVYANGYVTFSTNHAAVEPLTITYTGLTLLLDLMPLATTYEWTDVIKVDYQYSNGTVSTQFRYPTMNNGRIYVMAGDERIYWSDITENGSEYESWPPFNYWPIKRGAGDNDGCLISMFSELYIFQNRSIHRLRDKDRDFKDFKLEEVVPDIGCAGPRAARLAVSKIYFISEQGLYEFNGMDANNLSRDRIPALWDRINKPALYQSAVYAWHGLILFALPLDTSTTNDLVIAYDPSTGAFWPWDGMTISCWEEISTTSETKLYAGSCLNGYVLEQDIGTNDAGTNITAYFEPGVIDAGSPYKEKKARYIYVEYGPDQETWGTVSASQDYSDFLELVARNKHNTLRKFAIRPTIKGKWRYLGIRVEHDQADGFEVRSVMLPYKIKDKAKVKDELE